MSAYLQRHSRFLIWRRCLTISFRRLDIFSSLLQHHSHISNILITFATQSIAIMYPLTLLTSLVMGTSVLHSRQTSNTFQLNATGGQTGPISQIDDGQVRAGLTSPASTFTINGSSITDASGRGCILTRECAYCACLLKEAASSRSLVPANMI